MSTHSLTVVEEKSGGQCRPCNITSTITIEMGGRIPRALWML